MAVSWGAAGTAVYSVGNSAPGYPTGITAGDMLLLLVGTKPDTSTNSAPGDWTSLISYASTTGTTGIDTGPMLIEVWYKIADGSETGTITVTNDGSNSISAAQILRVGKDAGSWEIAGATGEDTSGGTSWSATCSSNPGITSGDFLVFGGVIPTDVSTPTQFSAEAVTATGATIGTATEIGEWDTSSGQDMGGFMAYASCTAGTASAAPVVTATAGGTTTNVYGPSYVIRLRENDAATSAYPQAATVASESANATCTPAPQVPPAHQSTTVSSWTYSDTITIAVPANAAAGDVMVVGIYSENTTTAISPPDGTWTQIGNQQTAGAPSFRSAVFWKRLTGADSGNYVFTTSGGPYSGGFCSRFTGVIDTGDAVDNYVDAKNDGQTSDSPANVYLTPNSAPTYVYAAGFDYGGDSSDGTVGPTSPDSSWVELYNPHGNAEDGVAWGHDLLTADEIGPVQITSFASGTGSTIHILTLKAPSAGSPSTNANAQAAEATTATVDAGTSTSPTVQSADVATATADATTTGTSSTNAQAQSAEVATATADASASKSAQPIPETAAVGTATVDATWTESAQPTVEAAQVATASVDATTQTSSSTNAQAQSAGVATATADATASKSAQPIPEAAAVATATADASASKSAQPIPEAAQVTTAGADVTAQTAAYANAPAQSAEVATATADASWTEAALAQVQAATVSTAGVDATGSVGAPTQVATASTASVDAGISTSPTAESAAVAASSDVNPTSQTAAYTNAQAQSAEVATSTADATWIEVAYPATQAASATLAAGDVTADKNVQPVAQAATASAIGGDPGVSASPTPEAAAGTVAAGDVTAQTEGMTQAPAQAAAASSANADAIARIGRMVDAAIAEVLADALAPSLSVGPVPQTAYAMAGVADVVADTSAIVVRRPNHGYVSALYTGVTARADAGHIDRPQGGGL